MSEVNGIGTSKSYSGEIQYWVHRRPINIFPATHLPGLFSGYFTVDEKYKSNMFFWFFPAQKASTSAPVLLWLQGGPGGSSMFGLFVENGPLQVDKDGQGACL